MIFLDTETCGFHGLAVLLQYAEDDGDIIIWNIWKETVSDTLNLLEYIASQEVCGFNLAFDWFHLNKINTIWRMLPGDAYPVDMIAEIAELEPEARTGPCLKPKAALDLMLFARKGPYQSLMDRKDIRIRRVPTPLAYKLAEQLEEKVQLDEIYFSRRKDKLAPKWKVMDIRRNDGTINPELKDIVLKFHASGSLKTLAIHALKVKEEEILRMGQVGVDPKAMPNECGWAPFAKAIGSSKNWNHAWPDVIKLHINYWSFNPLGRKYANNDIVYTRGLYKFFGCPAAGDNDSELACMVGAVRWHGFKIDIPKIKALREEALIKSKSAPKAPNRVLEWLLPVMDATEQLALLDRNGKRSTKKIILESVANWKNDDNSIHPAAERASLVLEARKAKKKVELYDKLLQAGRFHASFVVIGTLSSRMAGSDGLNPQGIDRTKQVRSCFPLADDGYILCGGDMDSFEVVLADAVYNDPKLRADLTTLVPCDKCQGTGKSGACKECGGSGKVTKKIHALFAMKLFPGETYDQIMASKGTKNDHYIKGKTGVFAKVYGGDENTLSTKIGVPVEVAKKANLDFDREYTRIPISRMRIERMFCSMRQPKGLGTNVEWHEPADYIESLLGFKRYFTLENKICKAIFQLACNPPKDWKDINIKVTRRDREQTANGAVMSALYAAAFQIQARNMRAAANHEIQCTGAEITKTVQRRVWDIQPIGSNDWVVIPMNVHDEVMTPTKPQYVPLVTKAVKDTVDSFREKVPLIKIEWSEKLDTWASK